MSPPEDLVKLGYISGPYGLKGWVHVVPASQQAEALLNNQVWWLLPSHQQNSKAIPNVSACQPVEVSTTKFHSNKLVAKFAQVQDRTAALNIKGAQVFVPRSCFPQLNPDEFYWVDLQGCTVKNTQGEQIGVVKQVVDHGAHPILEVGQHLIPFVKAYILEVKLQERLIIADWQFDYT